MSVSAICMQMVESWPKNLLKNVTILKLASILGKDSAALQGDGIFFYRNNIFWGQSSRDKKAFYSIVSSNIPFSFTAISWGLVFILHTANIHVGHFSHFWVHTRTEIEIFVGCSKIPILAFMYPSSPFGSKVTTARSFAGMFPMGGQRHPSLLAFFRKLSGVRISRQMYLFSTSFGSQLKSKTFLPLQSLKIGLYYKRKAVSAAASVS